MSSNKLFSRALFMENIRRFWVADLAALFFYFLSGPIEIISNNGELSHSNVELLISSGNPGFLFLGACLSVDAAVTVFSYLNKTGSTCVMHAMPFSRKKLFATNYVSGLVIASAPLILSCLVLLCFVQPVENFDYAVNGTIQVVEDLEIYSAAAVFKTLGVHMINIVFSYSLAVLACVLSGNGIIATLTACAFNCLAPAIYLCMLGYADIYLFGYESIYSGDAIVKLHPILESASNNLINGEATYSPKYMVLYILIAAAATIAAYYIYKLRPLETAGDSYSFGAMEKFVVICITFLFSSAFGLVFMELMDNVIVGYVTLFMTAVAAFVIGQMIAKKSFHIFNLESFKLMGLALAAVLAVITAFSIDICGFEKTMPDENEIESVTISSWDMFITNDSEAEFCDPENIEAALALHKEIVSRKSEVEAFNNRPIDYDSEVFDYGRDISFKYTMKDGSTFTRSYNVPDDMLIGNKDLESMRTSDEALKELYALGNLQLDGAEGLYTFYGYDDYPMEEFVTAKLSPDMIQRFTKAVIEDEISKNIFEDEAYTSELIGSVDLEVPVSLTGVNSEDAQQLIYEQYEDVYGFCWSDEADVEGQYTLNFSFAVYTYMEETLKVLPEL